MACILFFEGFENQEIFLPKTCVASNEDEHSELSTAIFFGDCMPPCFHQGEKLPKIRYCEPIHTHFKGLKSLGFLRVS